MQASRVVLWICLLGFAAFGLAFTLFPAPMAALVQIELPTDTARTDFVATYGGLELGVAAFLWVCTRRDERVHLGLVASALVLAGFGITRLAGILSSQRTEPVELVFLGIEIFGVVLSYWALRRHPRPTA